MDLPRALAAVTALLALCVAPGAQVDEFVELWRRPFAGAVEGEPIVAGGRLVIAALEGPGKRALSVVDVVTGKDLVPKRVLRTPGELAPSHWRGRILVRAGERRFELWSLDERRLNTVWGHTSDEPIDGALLHRGTVFAVVDGGVSAFDPGRRAPRWYVRGGFRGTPALLNEALGVVRYDDSGNAELVSLDPDDGHELRSLRVGGNGSTRPIPGPLPRIHASSRDLFIELAVPVRTSAGSEERFVWNNLRRPGSAFRTTGLLSPPALLDDGWIGWRASEATGEPLLVREVGPSAGTVLIDGTTFPELVADMPPPLARGDSVALGRMQFKHATGRVTWTLPADIAGTLLYSGDLILVREERALVAYRRGRVTSEQALAPAHQRFDKRTATLAQGVVARDNATPLRGRVAWNPRSASLTVRSASAATEVPLGDALWVEDGEQRCWFARSEADAVRGIQSIADVEAQSLLAELLPEAGASRDIELLSTLLNEAADRGMSHRAVTDGVRRLELLERQPALRVDAPRASRVRRSLASIDAVDATSLWERIHALDDSVSMGLRTALLDVLFAMDAPEAIRSRARAAVIELLPADLPAPRGFDPRSWLSFARRTAGLHVRVLGRGAAEQGRTAKGDELLASAREAWRKDLHGFESENLLVLSPLTRPDAIAHCLERGEALCQMLDGLFGMTDVEADERVPLALLLYPDRESYLRLSAGGEAASGLAWTAGHYNLETGLSHMFIPAGEAALERTLETYLHELTHHWIHQRMRRMAGPGLDEQLPGFWIVEGFASMWEELPLDPDAWTDAAPAHRDEVVHRAGKHTLDWKRVLGLSQQEFLDLTTDATLGVRTRRYLGRDNLLSQRSLFYHQAAAASRFLFLSGGGAHRGALLEYMRGYMSGSRVDLTRSFGKPAQALGSDVQAWIEGEFDRASD